MKKLLSLLLVSVLCLVAVFGSGCSDFQEITPENYKEISQQIYDKATAEYAFGDWNEGTFTLNTESKLKGEADLSIGGLKIKFSTNNDLILQSKFETEEEGEGDEIDIIATGSELSAKLGSQLKLKLEGTKEDIDALAEKNPMIDNFGDQIGALLNKEFSGKSDIAFVDGKLYLSEESKIDTIENSAKIAYDFNSLFDEETTVYDVIADYANDFYIMNFFSNETLKNYFKFYIDDQNPDNNYYGIISEFFDDAEDPYYFPNLGIKLSFDLGSFTFKFEATDKLVETVKTILGLTETDVFEIKTLSAIVDFDSEGKFESLSFDVKVNLDIEKMPMLEVPVKGTVSLSGEINMKDKEVKAPDIEKYFEVTDLASFRK